MTTLTPHLAFCRRLLSPDDLGHAVSPEVRAIARALLQDSATAASLIYLAGPMTGRPDLNRPQFFAAETRLRDMGYTPINPARNGLPPSAPWHHHMRRDLSMLLACAQVALLPGWESSRGARLESAWAQELHMPVHLLDAVPAIA